MKRKDIESKIWNTQRYYERISEIDKLDHPALKYIRDKVGNALTILDVGCGDGSKLSTFGGKQTKRYGCDISNAGVGLGKKKYKNIAFNIYDGEKLPYKNNSIENITCMFVLEHTNNPESLIDEMIRVSKNEGNIYLLAPNFGVPNRASPNFKHSRFWKLVSGFISDLLFNGDRLDWNFVVPDENLSMDNFQSDLDTTCEPNLVRLVRFVRKNGCELVMTNSYWSLEEKSAKFIQKIFRFFGTKGIYPFNYWGPHMFIHFKVVK